MFTDVLVVVTGDLTVDKRLQFLLTQKLRESQISLALRFASDKCSERLRIEDDGLTLRHNYNFIWGTVQCDALIDDYLIYYFECLLEQQTRLGIVGVASPGCNLNQNLGSEKNSCVRSNNSIF
jgi:hypothetical protein